MNGNFNQLLVGFLLSALIGFSAWRVRALSRSGAWAATMTGGLVFGLGGLAWAALLLTFFFSSSFLSRLFTRRKAAYSEKFSKGSQRDKGQVLANGGLGAFLVILFAVTKEQTWPWVAFIGGMAAVNADTWATELGILNPTKPRLITNGKPVERGTSGGVTVTGYAATIGGALLVGGVAALFTPAIEPLILLVTATLAGLAGSSLDSLLGATVQAIYFCPQCQKETERHPYHTCGEETIQVRGWRWLNNDWVNFFCSLMGATVALVLYALVFH